MMLKDIAGKIKNKYLILGLLITLNLSLKIFILFNSNQLIDPSLDKCFLVNFAKDTLLGEERLSILYYFDLRDAVSGLFTGTLLTISFMIFGISGYALKIIPILTSTAIVGLVYLFLNRFFNKKAAIITSLLFIFAPFAYTIRTFITWEDYKGSILLTFLIMYLFFNIFYNDKKSCWNFILLGLVSGFALSFYLVNFVVILTFMFFWFSFDKKFFIKKNFLIFLSAFLIVLSPLIVYNYTYDFGSFDIVEFHLKVDNNQVKSISKLPIFDNLINLVIKDVPSSFNFNGIGKVIHLSEKDKVGVIDIGVFLNYAYYLIFVVSFVFVFYRNRESFFNFIKNVFLFKSKRRVSKETFFIVYPILYISAYLLLGMMPFSHLYYTHLLPLYPFIFISIGLFAAHLYQKENWKPVSIVAIIFVLFLGLKCNLDLLSLGAEERVDYLEVCGMDKTTRNKFMGLQLKDISLAKKECRKLSKEERRGCYEGIVEYISRSYLVEKDISKSFNNCKDLGEYKNDCIESIAGFAGGEKNAPKTCEIFPKDYKKICYLSFGMSIALNNKNYIEECKKVGDEYFNYCKKGYLEEVHG